MKTTAPQSALPSVAEYGSIIARDNPSRRVTLETKPAFICGKVRQVELASVSPGYVPAGSALRLQSSPAWSVRWSDGGADHGRSFATEAEAREHFATYPAPPVNKGRALDHLAAGGKAWLFQNPDFTFSGFIVGNNVNTFHFFDGWHLACRMENRTAEEMETSLSGFESYLDRELGNRAAIFLANSALPQ